MHGPYERFLEKFGTSDCNLKESVVYDVLKVDIYDLQKLPGRVISVDQNWINDGNLKKLASIYQNCMKEPHWNQNISAEGAMGYINDLLSLENKIFLARINELGEVTGFCAAQVYKQGDATVFTDLNAEMILTAKLTPGIKPIDGTTYCEVIKNGELKNGLSALLWEFDIEQNESGSRGFSDYIALWGAMSQILYENNHKNLFAVSIKPGPLYNMLVKTFHEGAFELIATIPKVNQPIGDNDMRHRRCPQFPDGLFAFYLDIDTVNIMWQKWLTKLSKRYS
jgi:hypothetical protein